MQENINDPLGILSSKDPLGILKKKDGGGPKPPISTSQYLSPLPQEDLPLGIPQQKRSVSQEALTAREKINKSISDSDDILTRLIRENRLSAFETQQQATPQLDGVPNPSIQSAKRFLITQSPVTPDEVVAKKQEAMSDDKTAREVLKRVAKKDPTIASSAYIVDAQQRAVPEKENQILANADKIARGELTYNISKGILQQPQGIIESGIRGFKERATQIKNYEKYKNAVNPEDKIKILEEGFASYDPDKPVPVPEGASAQFAEMFGMEGIPMLKSATAATITGLIPGAQAAAPLVAAFAASPEYYKRSYESGLRSAYYELRQRGKTPEEALVVAEDQAQKEGIIGAAEGAVSSALGARIGFKPSSIVQSPVMKGALGNAVSASANVVRQMAPEAAADAGAAGLLQIASNLTARDNGLDRGVFDGVQENIAGEVGFTIGMGILTKGGRRLVDPNTYRTILNGFARQPKSVTDAKLGEMIVTGAITPEDAVDVSREIERERGLDAQIPKTIPETVRPQISEMIEKRNDLKQQLASANEAFHPTIKEEIKSIDEQILSYATNESQVQEGRAEGDIVQPQGTLQGQQEVGQGEGIQGQTQITPANVSDSNIGSQGAVVTLAPFFDTTVKTAADAQALRQTPEYKRYIDSIPTVAKAFGLNVNAINETIGGFENAEGNKIVEISNRVFVDSTDLNQVEKFAAIMGTMTPETQEATIAAKFIAENDIVPEGEYLEQLSIKVSDIDKSIEALQDAGIYDFTIDESDGSVSFLDFSQGTDIQFEEKIANFERALQNRNIQYEEAGRSPVQSKYISPERRTELITAIESDAAGLQQGGPDFRSIIAEAKQRDKAFRGELTKELTQELVTDPISKAAQSLKSTGVSIDLIESPAEYDTMVEQLGGQRGTEGVFLSNEGRILLNKSKLNDAITAGRIVWHESSHPVINIIRNTNPELYNRVISGMKASDNPAVQRAIQWANDNYQGQGVIDDESIVEAIAMVADGTLDLNTVPTGLKQSIIDFINLIARALGFNQVLNDTDVAAFKKLAGQVADVLTSGRDVAEVVGRENVKATENQLAQLRASSADIAKKTEDKTIEGIAQPSMILMGKQKGKDVELYSGPASITDLRSIKPDMYISRAEELAKSDLVQGKTRAYSSSASQESKLKWADNVYAKAKETVLSNLLYIYDAIPSEIRDISKLWYDGANIISQELSKKYNTTLEQASAVIASQSPQKPWYDNVHLAHFIMDFYANKKDMEFSRDMYEYYASKSQPTKQNSAGYPKQIQYLPTLEKSIGKKFSDLSNYDKSVMIRADFDNNYERRAPLRIPTGVIVGRVGSMSSFSGYDTIAKAVSILENGSEKNISDNLGKAFKVRNFNNNIANPKMDGEVTIDTHAMAAAYMLPLGSSSPEVKFDEATYAFFADAYRDAASQRGVLAREMQSIVWEGVRSVFPASDKSEANKTKAREIWSNYKNGSLTLQEVQKQIKENGKDLSITDWSRFTDRLLEEDGQSSYLEELPLAGGDQSASGLRDGGRDSGRVSRVGEGGIQPSQASVGNRLAPNGKPSSLTEQQYKQVRTPQFKNWFGDWENDPENASKVVDDNGEPLVVYHGTSKDKDFNKFNVPDRGAWFTDDSKEASNYAVDNDNMRSNFDFITGQSKDQNTSSRVIPVFLNIKKLYNYETDVSQEDRDKMKYAKSYRSAQRDIFRRLYSDAYSIGQHNVSGVDMGGGIYVALGNANQIKSAVGNSGEFSNSVDKLQASVGNRDIINGFYSPIEDRINTFKQPKASVQKWKEIVGVKSDEAVYSGLADWLGGKKPDQQLSKEEVLQFMKDNRIEISEVQKSDTSRYDIEKQRLLNKYGVSSIPALMTNATEEEKQSLFALQGETEPETKYSKYQLPGGENYKEVLITLPGKQKFINRSHFDEANVITHLRMNTRTDADGKKVLFLEEVQSDWGQKGKREGFKSEDKELQAKFDEVSQKAREADTKLTKAMREYRETNPVSSIKSAIEAGAKDIEKLYDEYQKFEEVRIGMLDSVRKLSEGVTPAPYVTNTNAWVKLGLKVALKEAVKQDADRIAWTTGDQQNERYDLSKSVKRIDFIKVGGDRYKYEALGLDSKRIAYDDNGTTSLQDIENMFGKDVAEKVKADKAGDLRLQGDGLKVGGKGMKAFYGDAQTQGIVGNVAKALVKELTGKEGAIVPSRLSSARNQDVIDRYNRARQYGNIPEALAKEYEQSQGLNSEQPAIDITPELSYAVTGGMPQFSVGNRPENNSNFKLGAFVMRKKAEGATDGEIAIAIASVTGMKPEDIKTLIDNPEQYIRDMFPSMSKLQQDNLIQKAKIQNIYRGRQFGKPIDKAFTGLEVPQEYVDEYMNKTAKSDNAVKEWATDFKRKWLDPAKGLPDWVLAIKDFASGSKNIEIARASKTIERLKDEAKKIGFTDWDAFGKALVVAKDVKRYIPNEDGVVPFDAYRAAAGKMFTTPDDQLPALVPDEIKALPDDIIPYVYAMRGQIDNLTRDLIGNGYVTPEQAVNLENNIGEYVNRSYRMFNEMGYKPEPEVMNAAIKFLADDYVKKLATDKVGAVSDQRIYEEAIDLAKKDVDAILNKKKNPFFNTSVDRRNTGILQQRQEIPEPLRKLMGEYTDPGTVFMMTVAKQAALKASSQYLNKLRENGMGNLFFEQNDPSRPASHSVQIAAAGTESMNPLGGLYTTPEIAEAIEMAEPTYNELTQAWMKLVGAVRWGKTVGSVATQFKNFESNLGFAVLNGYLMSGQNTAAFKASAKYVKGQYSKAEIDAITDKAIRLNLVGQSVGAREIKEMLGSGDVHDIALDIALGPDGKWGKKVAKKLNVFKEANKLYRLGDDFWKVYAYMTEREQLSDARFNGSKYDELTKEQQEQIDVESSERVKNTWPTYDRVIEGAKFVSKRAPIFGNFISFQAESLRVLSNSIKLAKQDMADPQLRHLGVRRAVGIAAYFVLRSAITIGLAKAAGFAAAGVLGAAFGDDEEERNKRAIKQALPPFMRTSDLAVIRTKEPHKFTVISLSSLDPYAIIPNSLNAYTEGREGIFGKTMDPGVAAATTELFSAFLEPEMTFSTMWSVVNNIDPKTKQEIVLSSDSDAQAAAKVGAKVWDMLEPSSVALVQRFFERKDKEAEILAIGGARPYDVDLHKSFGYILSQFGKDIDAINREYNSIKYREGMSQQEKDAAEMAAEDKKAFAISKLNETYRDFMNLGADPKVLNELINQRSSIKVTGFDKNTKNSIKTGKINKKTLFK